MIDFFISNKDIVLQLSIVFLFLIIGYFINKKIDFLKKYGIKTKGQVIDYKSNID